MATQEVIEKAIIGKRIVAVAWVPIPDVGGVFALGSVTFQGGAVLELGHDQEGAVLARLREDDHADA